MKRLLALFGLILLLAGLVAGSILLQERQELRKKAEILTPEAINKKVLLVIYDPVLSNGKKLHEARRWGDPQALTNQIIDFIRSASGGAVNYQVTELAQRNEWPRKTDGFRYTESTYNTCMSDTGTCHRPDDMDYLQMWNDLDICNKASSGQVDEVFIYGFPYAGFDEFAFKIPSDRVPYNRPTNPWLYDGRKRNIPDCNGKTVFVMGFNYEVGLGNALESYVHRIESAMALTVGRGMWSARCGSENGTASDFDHFTCIDQDANSSSPVTVAGCGQSHYAPNSTAEYTYDNRSYKPNACASWNSYPFRDKAITQLKCEAWGCTKEGFYTWMFGHIPKNAGLTENGNLRNWWKYIADFDNAVAEARTPVPTPTLTPTPTSTPTPTRGAVPSNLQISLRFQGIGEGRASVQQDSFVELRSTTPPTTNAGSTVTFSSNERGVFTGTFTNITLQPDTYDVYVTGPVHPRRKVGSVVLGTNNTSLNATSIELFPGDLTSDGKIDLFDFNKFVEDFGPRMPQSGSPADFDQNRKVDLFDYNLFVPNFGKVGE